MRGSPFFDGVRQIDVAKEPHEMKVPIFYFDGSAITLIFPAKLNRLRALLPDPRFQPVRIAPGVGAVAISCFEYRDTDIGAYNELAIAPVICDSPLRRNRPGRELLRTRQTGQFHAYVHHLPVTTEIARLGGRHLYNYPKFLASIDFSESADTSECRLSEGQAHILTIKAARISAKGSREMQLFSNVWMDRQPQSSEFKINALSFGESSRPGKAQIELGHGHPIADELDRLLLSQRALHLQTMPQFEGILYGPGQFSLPLIERSIELIEAGRRVAR